MQYLIDNIHSTHIYTLPRPISSFLMAFYPLFVKLEIGPGGKAHPRTSPQHWEDRKEPPLVPYLSKLVFILQFLRYSIFLGLARDRSIDLFLLFILIKINGNYCLSSPVLTSASSQYIPSMLIHIQLIGSNFTFNSVFVRDVITGQFNGFMITSCCNWEIESIIIVTNLVKLFVHGLIAIVQDSQQYTAFHRQFNK